MATIVHTVFSDRVCVGNNAAADDSCGRLLRVRRGAAAGRRAERVGGGERVGAAIHSRRLHLHRDGDHSAGSARAARPARRPPRHPLRAFRALAHPTRTRRYVFRWPLRDSRTLRTERSKTSNQWTLTIFSLARSYILWLPVISSECSL